MLTEYADAVGYMKARRIRWTEHIVGTDNERTAKIRLETNCGKEDQ